MEFHSANMNRGLMQDAACCSVHADAKLIEVLKVAHESYSPFLFVEDDDGKPMGVLATEDVLRRVTSPSPHETQRWMDMTVEAMLPGRLDLHDDKPSFDAIELKSRPVTQVSRNGTLLGMMTDDDVFISWKTVRNTLTASQGDGVTGLPNRATFDYHLESECNRAARLGTSVAVILVDLDFFKQVNDQYGHSAGDTALKVVSTALRRSLRSYDLVARFGGDEFAVICNGFRLNEVDIVTRRLRETVMALQSNPDIPQPVPSISVGAAVAFDVPSSSIKRKLIDDADECLYAAKRVGRNCAFKKELHVLAPSDPVFVPDDYSDTERIETILAGAPVPC